MDFTLAGSCLTVNAACVDACVAQSIHIGVNARAVSLSAYVNPTECIDCDDCVRACSRAPLSLKQTQSARSGRNAA